MSVSELDAKRTEAMNIMMEWLLVLRSALNITQGELAHRVASPAKPTPPWSWGKKRCPGTRSSPCSCSSSPTRKPGTCCGKNPATSTWCWASSAPGKSRPTAPHRTRTRKSTPARKKPKTAFLTSGKAHGPRCKKEKSGVWIFLSSSLPGTDPTCWTRC